MRPLGFRIWDFKSIRDSGYCSLSEDGITAIAGQNESGKTSLLTALRDFDLNDGLPPETPDYFPDEDSENRNPRAGVEFAISPKEIGEVLGTTQIIPKDVRKAIEAKGTIWIYREFSTGEFGLSKELKELFAEAELREQSAPSFDLPIIVDEFSDTSTSKSPQPTASIKETATVAAEAAAAIPAVGIKGEPSIGEAGANITLDVVKPLTQEEFASLLRRHAPYFIYFDTFKDELPREVSIQPVIAAKTDEARDAAFKELPVTVRDFLALAQVNIHHLAKVSNDDRLLGNYLHDKAANITGHFLAYWRQRTDAEETVQLRTQHARKASGELFLSFYVNDGKDQYPDQRSRGFLWFLSFFLRLTSANLTKTNLPSLILIDEPGTFLHSKAQKDVLALLENWIVKKHSVLYSTHSPYLLPADKLHRVRLVGKLKKKGTYVADRLTDSRLRGSSFTDALSPVLTSIGLDLNESFNLVQKKNILVEGISDYYYLHAWNRFLKLKALDEVSIFPGTAASTVPTLASLLIGWGVNFCALLDRDGPGNGAAKKLRDEMGIDPTVVIQFTGGIAIEDLFESADFSLLLKSYDPNLVVDPTLSLSKTMTKLSIDKVLLARHFAEIAGTEKISSAVYSAATTDRVKSLFMTLTEAMEKQPIKPRMVKQ